MFEDHNGDLNRNRCFSCFNKKHLLQLLLFWVAGVMVALLIFGVPYIMYKVLPEPKSSVEAGFLTFSEERARNHLDHLVNIIGPRPVGSYANTNDTVKYITTQIEKIQNSSGRLTYYVDQQPGYRISQSQSRLSLWDKMQNIVVRLNGTTSKSTLLLSAHYDTVTMSPGAADDGKGVACLLEVMDVMAHREMGQTDVIFLFVNGEEPDAFGSWQFVNQNISFDAFVNVDGTPGHKNMIFRSSGGFLDFAFMSVPKPLGFVVAKEVFNLGFTGSFSDWTNYDINAPGLDYASFSGRQLWHTISDAQVPDGAFQYLGDNLVALISRIISTSYHTDRTPHVFFSILNSGFVVYSLGASLGLHIFFSVLLLGTLGFIITHRSLREKSSFRHFRILGLGGVVALVTLVSSIGTGIVASIIAEHLGPWFAWSSTAMGIWSFVFPCLSAVHFVHWIVDLLETYFKVNIETSRLHVLWGHGFLACIVLFSTIFFSARQLGFPYLIYLTFSSISLQLIVEHVFYLLGFMSSSQEDSTSHSGYSPLNNDILEDISDLSTPKQGTASLTISRNHPKTTQFLWFLIFFIGVVPLVFIADVLPILFDFASAELSAIVYGPVIGLVVYLFTIHFMTFSKKTKTFGYLSLLTFILGVILFFSFVATGRTHFNQSSPYNVQITTTNGVANVVAREDYWISLESAWAKLPYGISDFQLTNCINPWRCSTSQIPLLVHPNISGNDFGNGSFSVSIFAPGAQWHRLSGVYNVYGNFSSVIDGKIVNWDLEIPKDTFFSEFELLLSSPPTNDWQFGFSSTSTPFNPQWTCGWSDPSLMQNFTSLIDAAKRSDFFTLRGTGRALHSQSSYFSFVPDT